MDGKELFPHVFVEFDIKALLALKCMLDAALAKSGGMDDTTLTAVVDLKKRADGALESALQRMPRGVANVVRACLDDVWKEMQKELEEGGAAE